MEYWKAGEEQGFGMMGAVGEQGFGMEEGGGNEDGGWNDGSQR